MPPEARVTDGVLRFLCAVLLVFCAAQVLRNGASCVFDPPRDFSNWALWVLSVQCVVDDGGGSECCAVAVRIDGEIADAAVSSRCV